jgi:hypothetical protein
MKLFLKTTLLLIPIALLFPGTSYATCPPVMNNGGAPLVPVACTDQKTVSEFTGAAAQSLKTIRQNISTAGSDIVKAYNDSTQSQISIISDTGANIVKTLIQLNGSTVADNITRSRMLHEAKMDYMMELNEAKIQAKNSPLGASTTPEEMKFILKLLSDNSDTKVKDLIPIIKKQVDDNDIQIPVKIKAAKGICDEADENACAVMTDVSPGHNMEILWKECSREKRVVSASISKHQAITRVKETMQQSQTEALEIENTTQAAAQRLLKQRKISCSPEEYTAELCGTDLTKREYAEAIFSNTIVNNGNISASNFYQPPVVGSVDGTHGDSSEDDIKLAAQTNMNYEGNESPESTPPLINTFKSSNQYQAALDMVDNILNESAVANQALAERRNLSNAEFQAGYLSRMAALSLSKYSLQNSINNRLGSNVQNQLEYDREAPVKENFNGAGTLDQLIFDIESDYEKVSGDQSGEMYEKNEKGIAIMMLEAQLKQNKLVLEQILRNERIELLLASILATEYNSPEYTITLNSLRGK